MTALSSLYGRLTQLRRAWYGRHPDRRRRLSRPVISIGNLVVGGSGKTPTVAALARLLLEAGERPAILTRGYGRRHHADGAVVVSDGERVLEPALRSGDEPQMLARALPGVVVIVSGDRYVAGRLAERRFGSTLHLLDDGFQHLALARDVDVLLVAREDLDERVLPAGRLREPLAAAGAADAILASGTVEDMSHVAARLDPPHLFQLVPGYGEPRRVVPFGETLAAPGRRAIAVAGIARPRRFFAALRALGWDVAQEIAFRDHHWFTARDIARIERSARDAGADVVLTTEKDAVRLADLPPSLAPMVGYLPMHVDVEPRDAFETWLLARVARARDRRVGEAA